MELESRAQFLDPVRAERFRTCHSHRSNSADASKRAVCTDGSVRVLVMSVRLALYSRRWHSVAVVASFLSARRYVGTLCNTIRPAFMHHYRTRNTRWAVSGGLGASRRLGSERYASPTKPSNNLKLDIFSVLEKGSQITHRRPSAPPLEARDLGYHDESCPRYVHQASCVTSGCVPY